VPLQRPLRVAQVCGTTDGGLWMVQIALGLQRRGFEVTAIIGGPSGGTAAALRKAGIPYRCMDQPLRSTSRIAALMGALPLIGLLRGVVDVLAVLRKAIAMARVFRELEIDIVHSHLVNSMVIARLAGAIARVPIRVSMIAGPLHLESRWFRKIDTATYRLDDRILAGCQYTNDLYAEIGVPASKRTTVGYGIDPSEYDPSLADRFRVRHEFGISDGTPLIGQVAFFYPPLRRGVNPHGAEARGIKGHEDLLAAAQIVLQSRPDVRFLVVGDGFGEAGQRHFEDIQRLACSLGVDHAVIFAGRRRDLVDVIAALDVSVQCSLSENYGGTVESLLLERPMVATAVGGMTETVIHGETGLLVPVHSPADLAAAMLRLIENRELAQALGRAGRTRMLERHTIQRTIEGVVQVYGEVARTKGITRPPLDGSPSLGADHDAGLGLMPRHVLFGDE
jgi:glycosyltransferase involved in cell wall biosynthesis